MSADQRKLFLYKLEKDLMVKDSPIEFLLVDGVGLRPFINGKRLI